MVTKILVSVPLGLIGYLNLLGLGLGLGDLDYSVFLFNHIIFLEARHHYQIKRPVRYVEK